MTAGPPIFVVGTGRSGTTLLRMLLSAHPDIHLTHEGSFLIWDQILPGRHDGEALLRSYLAGFAFRWMGLDPELVCADLPRPLPRAEAWRLWEAVMRTAARDRGKTRWGDKTPGHSAHLERIFELWPEARVVRIVRDPRAVVRSLRAMPWATGTIAGATWAVNEEDKQARPFADRILTVRLEDLLTEPRAVMGRVLAYVGVDWSELVLDHPTHGPAGDAPPMPWFAGAARPLRPARPPSWSTWDEEELALVELLCGATMRRQGYARAAPQVGMARLLWRWVREWPRALRDGAVMLGVARDLTDPRLGDAAVDRWLTTLNPEAWKAWPDVTVPVAPAVRIPQR